LGETGVGKIGDRPPMPHELRHIASAPKPSAWKTLRVTRSEYIQGPNRDWATR
jgi:hypothetical protein